MKKQLLPIMAASLLLAACGNTANNDPLREPETKQEISRTEMAKHAAKLATNTVKVDGFGAEVNITAKGEYSIKTKENAELGVKAETYKSTFALENLTLKGALVNSEADGFSASASISSKLTYDFKIPSVTEDEEGKAKFTVLTFSEKGKDITLSAFTDGNDLYADLSGLKPLAEMVKSVSASLGEVGSSISNFLTDDLFTKVKFTGVAAMVTPSLVGVPAMISSYVATCVGDLTDLGGILTSADSSKYTYKEYVDGSYGLSAKLTTNDAQAVALPEGVTNNTEASGEAKIIFTDSAIKAAGMKANIAIKETSVQPNLPDEESEIEVPPYILDKVSGNVELGARVDFTYGNDVKVEKGNKADYKEIKLPELPNGNVPEPSDSGEAE